MKCRFSQRRSAGRRARSKGTIDLRLILLLICVGLAGWWVGGRSALVKARERDTETAGTGGSSSTAESPYAKVIRKRPVDQIVATQVVTPATAGDPMTQALVALVFVLGTTLAVQRFSAVFRCRVELGSVNLNETDAPCITGASFQSKADLVSLQGEPSADEERVDNFHATALAKHAPAQIAAISDRLLDLEAEPTAKARERVFEGIYVGMRSLAEGAERAELKELQHLVRTTEKLINKVMDQHFLATGSVPQTLLGALSLMAELCVLKHGAKGIDSEIRVLAVDDDIISQRTLAIALQQCVDAPDVAGDGMVALQRVEAQKYDLIFMDIMMPRTDGFEACSKLRQGLNRETPVVFITGKEDKESNSRARESGANGFISKPILPAEIAVVALTVTWRSRLAHSLCNRRMNG